MTQRWLVDETIQALERLHEEMREKERQNDDDEIIRIHTTHDDGSWRMYTIDSTYCWYSDWTNKHERIVLMYSINGIPFTFDELEDLEQTEEDLPTIKMIADYEQKYNTEDLYNNFAYLMQEQVHPLMFELELTNPEDLPDDIAI